MAKRTYEYRTIYTEFYGEVPKDSAGKSYDIHHKDGDHTNNLLENLVAVSIQEHYDIHYQNQDWGACIMIGMRMNISASELSKLNSLAALKRVADGTHHWLTDKHATEVKDRISKSVADGTYHMLGGKIQKEFQKKRVKDKTHQWCGPASNLEKLKNGTHASQKEFTCPHCGIHGRGSNNAKRWHFDNCKQKGK